jgi:hypothetical protein
MVIQLHDRKVVVAGLVQKLQHALAGFPLLLLGVRHLSEEGEMPIAILEIVIAGLVLATFARQVHAARKSHAAHSRVDYFDLAAAAMMMFEAFYGHHHKPPYLTPQFFTAVTTTAVALFHGKLHARRAKRRYVKLDENGVEVRTGLFRRFSLGWADLDRVHIAQDKAVFHLTDGKRHTIGFRMLGNHEEVRKHLADHALAAGVNMEKVS